MSQGAQVGVACCRRPRGLLSAAFRTTRIGGGASEVAGGVGIRHCCGSRQAHTATGTRACIRIRSASASARPTSPTTIEAGGATAGTSANWRDPSQCEGFRGFYGSQSPHGSVRALSTPTNSSAYVAWNTPKSPPSRGTARFRAWPLTRMPTARQQVHRLSHPLIRLTPDLNSSIWRRVLRSRNSFTTSCTRHSSNSSNPSFSSSFSSSSSTLQRPHRPHPQPQKPHPHRAVSRLDARRIYQTWTSSLSASLSAPYFINANPHAATTESRSTRASIIPTCNSDSCRSFSSLARRSSPIPPNHDGKDSTISGGSSSSSSNSSYHSSHRNLPLATSPIRPRGFPSSLLIAMASTTVTQKRAHGGHSHHHHHHDNVYLTSSNKNDAGVRITRIGLYSNLGMAFAKGAGGYMFGSQALIADAWHSLTDLASDILTLATVSWSLKPPTDSFPSGFGKVESLGSLGVSSMLLCGGLFMCWSSVLTLHAHFFMDPASAAETIAHMHHGHSHSHSHEAGDGHGVPSLHAAWLAAGTVAIKEWLYHATMKVARERKSSVLASNAVHHRVDSLTGVVTLAVVLGANLLRNAAWLDPVGGLFISLLVIKAGAENTVSALYELADRSIDEEVKTSVTKQAQKSLEARGERHEVEVRDVSGVKSGQNYLVDVELAVPGDWTVEEVREVEEAVRTQVGSKVRGVRRVRVRFVPKEAEVAPRFDEYIAGDVSQRATPEPEDDEHGHSHNGNGHHKH